MHKIVLFALITISHGSFVFSQGTELDKRIAAMRAKGEPVLMEDFKRPPIDPAANGRDQIEAAAAAINGDTPEYNALDIRDEIVRLPLTEFEEEKLAAISRQNEKCLALLDEAAAKPQADAETELKSPVLEVSLRYLNGSRALANIATLDAYNQMALGLHDAAIKRLSQHEMLAKYAASDPLLVNIFVSIGIHAMHADKLIDIAPQLNIGDADHAVPRATIEKLVAGLMDDTQSRSMFRRALFGERMASLDAIQVMRQGKPDPKAMKEAFGDKVPAAFTEADMEAILQANVIHVLDYYEDLLRHCDGPNAVTVLKAIDESTVGTTILKKKEDPSYMIAATIMPAINRVPATLFRVMTKREAAATALAVRLFAIDHDGKLPDKLDELVPKYLPRLPSDYLADNQPLKYRPGENPILWSVGRDGVDNGSAGLNAGERQGKVADEIFPLTNLPRNVGP